MSHSLVLLVCAAFASCSQRADERSEAPGTLPPGTSPQFAGELVLTGDLAGARAGVAVLSVHRVTASDGTAPAMLSRRFELGDPLWNDLPGRRSLYFRLDARDLEPAMTLALDAEMDLVARFDPDGDPRTDDPGSALVRQRVQTGSADSRVELWRAPAALIAPRAARANRGG